MRSAWLWLVVLGSPALADEPEKQQGAWLGVDAGYARLKRTYSVTQPTTQNTFALHFRGGYFWNPQWLVGVELGGWTMQAAPKDDPNKGEAIENLFAIARYYPRASSRLFVEGGLGRLRYWTNHPAEQGATGTGATLGIGHEIHWSNHYYVTPTLDYSQGHFDGVTSPPGVHQDERYRAITLRLGVTYR